MNTPLTIGLFGFGVVGKGLYDALEKSPAREVWIKSICVKNRIERTLPEARFCYDPDVILEDPEINTVVELINNDSDAYLIVKKALQKGKNVVSANKKMIAEHLAEMIDLQQQNNVSLLYEASACGSIPVIRNLEEYYDNDLLLSVTGILNGSSNYILSRIFDHNMNYEEALLEARRLGFVEKDPSFDVEGFDSLFKLIILTLHSFGAIIEPSEVLNYGISSISDFDIRYAREKGFKIKLVGQVERLHEKKIRLFVLPRFVGKDKYIYNVEDEFNGVVIKGWAYDKQFMFGKGAGGHPTGSAVLSDITALSYNYRYEYKKRKAPGDFTYYKEDLLEIYLRYQDPAVLRHFSFEKVSEEYKSSESSYKIGTIKLSALLRIKEFIRELNIFIAVTGTTLNY